MPVVAINQTRHRAERRTRAKGAARRTANCTIVCDRVTLRIPGWVNDHSAFRRWFRSTDFPEEGRVSFLNGELTFDLSREEIYSHNRVKTVIGAKLSDLVTQYELGEFFGDGTMISHIGAEMSNNPDSVFIANASFENKTVRFVEGDEGGYIEIEGSPDMVLEVVSKSTEGKDTVLLREAYWNAGIREYWLVDARGDSLGFQILKHTSKGYSPVRQVSGSLKSTVFGKSFRLIAKNNHLGHPTFELMVK